MIRAAGISTLRARTRSLCAMLMLACAPMLVHAQEHPDSVRTAAHADTLSRKPARSTVSAAADSGRALWKEPRPFRTLPASVITKDSTSLLPYLGSADILARAPGVSLYNGGSTGQPGWMGIHGSGPAQFSFIRNGASLDDVVTGRPTLEFLPSEDASEFIVHPAHLGFYFGRPGVLLAAETRAADHDAPHPYTRMRHAETRYDYLFTDVIFALNPGTRDNLSFDVTRQSNGNVSVDNIARFPFTRFESWDVRGNYRINIGDHLRVTASDTYNDQSYYLNGGSLPWRDDPRSQWIAYPDRNTTSFADTAFDPLLASFINPSMHAKIHRNEAALESRLLWDRMGAQHTTVRATVTTLTRSFSDRVAAGLPDSLQRDRLQDDNAWSTFTLAAEHVTTLPFAALTLRGHAQHYDVSYTGITTLTSGWNTSLSAALETGAGPVGIFGAVRTDHTFGHLSGGAGGTATLSLGRGISLWGGTSVSTRAPSLLELAWQSARTIDVVPRNTDADRAAVLEAGLRFESQSFTAALQGISADVRTHRRVSVGIVPDSLPSGLLRFSTVFDEEPVSTTLAGASLSFAARWWHIELDERASVTAAPGGGAPMLAPRFASSTSLAFRGTLIEGTLDLRFGATWTMNTAFDPTTYNPESDVFGVTPRGGIAGDGSASYTGSGRLDLFFFSTIKHAATIHLHLYNLLDERTITTAFQPMPDMAFRFGVDWTLFD